MLQALRRSSRDHPVPQTHQELSGPRAFASAGRTAWDARSQLTTWLALSLSLVSAQWPFSSERPPLPALAGRPLPHSDSMTSSCSFSSEPSDPLKSSGLCFVSSSLSLSPLEGRPQEVQDPACPAPSHSPRAGCAVDAQQGFLPPTRLSSLPPGETGLGGGVGV